VRAPVLVPGTRKVRWLRDEPRVALAAVVRAPQGTITVVSTHLSFVPGQNLLQLRRLARWLVALPGPQVLLGDLNMGSGPAALVSGFEVLARHATYPAPRPRRQVDQVLGHGALPPVRTSSVRALPVSDHLALSVDL
jgi:endonuclease/exonuclease/phosphatase family metal-dependent hydrolase